MAELSDSDRKHLLKNKHVLKVLGERVVYTPEFKIHAVQESLRGKLPSEIFRDAGIDISLFRDDYSKDTLKRWKKVHKTRGKQGFKEELRGKNSKGRPKNKFDPDDFESMKERIAYLEAENEFLKKLRALEEQYIKKNGLK